MRITYDSSLPDFSFLNGLGNEVVLGMKDAVFSRFLLFPAFLYLKLNCYHQEISYDSIKKSFKGLPCIFINIFRLN